MDPFVTPPPKTSAAAVWSLVLGILSMFCLWLLGSIPAIILGIVALKKINAQPTLVGGRGIAISGIVTGAVGIVSGMVIIGITASITMPAYKGIQDRAGTIKQVSEVRMLALSCRAYAADWGGAYPEKLADLSPEYVDGDSMFYADEENQQPYLYRTGLTTQSEKTPFILSPDLGSPKRIVAYTDGSVEEISEPLPRGILAEFE